MATAGSIVAALLEEVWNRGDADAVPSLLAPRYTIHRDPGDPWEGQTLDHAAFKERLAFCRNAIPDLHFAVEDMLCDGDKVAVRWRYRGTHKGDVPGLAASGRALTVSGITIYQVVGGKVSGHWQETDRFGLMQQLGAYGLPAAG